MGREVVSGPDLITKAVKTTLVQAKHRGGSQRDWEHRTLRSFLPEDRGLSSRIRVLSVGAKVTSGQVTRELGISVFTVMQN